MNNPKSILATGVVLGVLLTAGAYSLLGRNSELPASSAAAVDEPLYWVAPMDPNYQREKPGKSPMGMDLIPVYADQSGGVDAGPGTIRISPDVVNNLGVRSALVESKTLHTEINTVGYVTYDEDQLIHIHPRVEGWIDKLYVKAAGDPVEQGQPLYEIYSPELVNAQEELVLALGRNNKRLVRAAEDRLRALQLPASAIDQLKKTGRVEQSVTFYSPQSGVIDDLNIRQGFFVKPGTSLMSIGVLDQVWVEAEVFEDQAAAVTTGLPVTMTLDFLPGQLWQGRVDYVYPTLDTQTRTLKVRLRFDNDSRELKPNMFAQVAIHAQSGDETLLIPKSAVVRTGSMDRAVLALGEGQYKSVEVKLGRTGEDYAEILLGLEAGDRVVTSAQFLLDSESSKTSDFIRMNHGVADAAVDQMASVWTEAEINSVMPKHRMANLSHEAIEQWDWPQMTMDFSVAEGVDMERLQVGSRLQVEIQKNRVGSYEVVTLATSGDKMAQGSADDSATVEGVINSLMAAHGMINISRDAIEKWDRPAATVDFIAAPGVDLSYLRAGMAVRFSFRLNDGEFLISAIAATGDEGIVR